MAILNKNPPFLWAEFCKQVNEQLKELIMKNKNLSDVIDLPIKVDVSSLTEDERKELQLKLFEFGVKWFTGQTTPLYLWAHYYFIDNSSRLCKDDDDLNYFNGKREKQISVTKLKEVLGMTQKTFTKADLKTGMIIEFMNGEIGQVLLGTSKGDIITGENWFPLSDYKDTQLFDSNFLHGNCIKTVYDSKSNQFFSLDCAKRKGLSAKEYKVVWEREEKSPNQLEIEKIQAEMDVLNKRLGELKGKV